MAENNERNPPLNNENLDPPELEANDAFDDTQSHVSSAGSLHMAQFENRIGSQIERMANRVNETISSLTEHVQRKFSEIEMQINNLTSNPSASNPQNVKINSSNADSNQSNSAQNSQTEPPLIMTEQSKGNNSTFRMKPHNFNGPDQDFEEFLSQFEITCEINKWDYKAKSLYLANCLTGEARSLLNELDFAGRRDFKTLVDKLTNRYGSINRSEIYRAQLKSRVRNKNETIPELAQAIKKLTRQAYPEINKDVIETLSLDNFIDAITDSDIRMRLRELGPKTITEAERVSVRMEANKIADKQRSRLVGRLDCADEQKQPHSLEDKINGLCESMGNLTDQIKNMSSNKFQNYQKNTPNYPNRNQAYSRNAFQNNSNRQYNGPQRPGNQFRGGNSNYVQQNRPNSTNQGNRLNFNQPSANFNGSNSYRAPFVREDNRQRGNENQSAWRATTRQ